MTPATNPQLTKSDEPLAITEAAFQPGYLKKALGPAYRADDPYLTMRAISQEFVLSLPRTLRISS